MNSLVIIIVEKVTSNTLFICTTKGVTAADIFEKIDNVITQKSNTMGSVCIFLCRFNASVNMCKRNVIKGRVHETTPDVYFVGCHCHMGHKCGLGKTPDMYFVGT